MLDLVAVNEQYFPNFTPRPSDHVHLPHTYPSVNNYLTQEILDLVAVEEQYFPNFTPRPFDHVHLPHTYPSVNNYITQDMEPSGLIERWYEELNMVDDDKQDREEE
ncbi:hypothetical protein J4Q44_G00328490 [Coregonus suidteri]|uniref:Uncharacterized protein n=1 Tax=Coregonus suidteri TaxID=861788 RepID=A0AAN8QPF5_9TELE